MSKGEVSKPKNKTMEHLLIPRVRCIGHESHHYPNSPFAAGEILEVHQDGARLISIKTGHYIDWLKYKRYPHLFRELSWYENREASEMDNVFVKCKFDCEIDSEKFFRDEIYKVADIPDFDYLRWFKLSTETEYNQYLQTKQK